MDTSKRHAFKQGNFYSVITLWVMALYLFSACQPSTALREKVDKLNDRAYAYHYRQIDSAYAYAHRALYLANEYEDGQAEALNNMAFVKLVRMDYVGAQELLQMASKVTDNQIEQLVADVQMMRLCQRQSRNKDFYVYREKARRRLGRIQEADANLTARQRWRLAYAQSEYDIVSATYFYYVGQAEPFIHSLEDINPDLIQTDTAQVLNYLYNIGAGGAITQGTLEEINQSEFDYLLRCYLLAVSGHYPYWEAQALQAISEHMQSPHIRSLLIRNNRPAINFINTDQMPDSLLGGNLAQRSLNLFTSYGDVYQIAGANRTLATNYWGIGDYRSALACLQNALQNSAITQAPDLVASIREQLSLTYSALNDKRNSDYNRNLYLDLQDDTRQDRLLEARAAQLSDSSMQLNGLIAAIMLLIILLFFLLFIFSRLRRKHGSADAIAQLLQPLQKWKRLNELKFKELDDEYEELMEQRQVHLLHLDKGKRRHIEQRAKISLVNSIQPFIDRMANEVARLCGGSDTPAVVRERLEYISELTDKINEYNAVLTHWIQMQQGQLNLHIERFALQPLFDIIAKGRLTSQLRSVDLVVEPTDASVRADRTLTLFMLNTIVDNARKSISDGGRITVKAEEADNNMVRLIITDTGKGMTAEEAAHIFDRTYSGGHGFGLLNCKGIIEKYKKISSIFRYCEMSVHSMPGQGSTFSFTLPKGEKPSSKLRPGARTLLLVALSVCCLYLRASPISLQQMGFWTDSAYNANLAGHYATTLLYVDSVCKNYHQVAISSPADTASFNNMLLSVYNEGAVAALALHHWQAYRNYNKAYTHLFNHLSADKTLGSYVRTMQKSEVNKNVAIVLLVLLLFLIAPVWYFLYYRHLLFYRYSIERVNSINQILLSNVSNEERLHRIGRLWNVSVVSAEAAHSRQAALLVELNTVVTQIIAALHRGIQNYGTMQERIETAHDEIGRIKYEEDRLYVSNAVLDNSLSALKHETMYYPSRIRQLIDSHPNNFESLAELVNYYKELYTILSAQAMKQVEMGGMAIDASLLHYLFDILRKNGCATVNDVVVDEGDTAYVKVRLPMSKTTLSINELALLFTPLTPQLDFLLCRQIVRDLGEVTNLRACGIVAKSSNNKDIYIEMILPKKIWTTFK